MLTRPSAWRTPTTERRSLLKSAGRRNLNSNLLRLALSGQEVEILQRGEVGTIVAIILGARRAKKLTLDYLTLLVSTSSV
jgi:hypothetical protein